MWAGSDHGLAPERIVRQLESSLERLGADCADIYLAHDFDPDVPLSETFATFESLLAAGKIRAYSVSNFNAVQLEAALAAGAPQAVQNAHSLLERGDEADVLPLCAQREVAYLAFSPLSGGWLTGKYRRGAKYPAGSRMTQRPDPYQRLVADRTFDALEALDARARERDISMAGLALAWLLADDRVTQVVVGPGRPEHLKPVGEALAHPLGAEDRAKVEGLFA
jgi:aryl-alcohol dehydrogenase-like predicted oxidoreductase